MVKIYLVTTEQRKLDVLDQAGIENILFSYFYLRKNEEYVKAFQAKRRPHTLIDSGAFSFFRTGKIPDTYVDEYIAFVKENKGLIDNYVEMDVDKVVGLEQVLKYRKRMEDELGPPLIVWHIPRGNADWIETCKNYPYVGIGMKELKRMSIKQIRQYVAVAHKHGAKFHGFGYTDLTRLPLLDFDSVDSTSWLSANIYAWYYQFDPGTNRLLDYNRTEFVSRFKKLIHRRDHYEYYAAMLHSALQWKRYSDLMEGKRVAKD